jgi:site-specific DNA recombinase
MIAADLRKRRPKPHTPWHLDEVYLKIVLSFAQFEREVTGERIRDKIAASKKKGMWMGGTASGF